jgi:hypothetical protein
MEETMDLQQLTGDEALLLNGGGFAFDVGSVIGFILRSASGLAGQAEAYAIWFYQHPR